MGRTPGHEGGFALKPLALVAVAFVAGCSTQDGLHTAAAPSDGPIVLEAVSGKPIPGPTTTQCVAETGASADGAAPNADRALLGDLRRQVPDWLIEEAVPSVAVTYISDNAVSWTLVCGEQGPDTPATTSTLYNTASIAKPMVGEIVLRLASQNRVSLDEPMTAHWVDPDIADDPRRDRLTPRIALAHQTGFANWRRMSEGRLTFQWEPGTKRGYSGEGIRYVTRFLEHKLGKPFEDIAREVLFDPAGMRDASFVREPWFGHRVAWRRLADGTWAEPRLNDEPLGAGDVWTTSADYARFILAVLADSGVTARMAEERSSISMDEVPRLCGPDKTPVEVCPERMGFGVGWYVYEYDDHTVLAHNGANTGEKTLALFVAERQMGLAVFANGENGKAVISKIARTLYKNERFMTLEGY